MTRPNLYIGIMSGTSVDGIDVALVEIQHNQSRFVSGIEVPFDAALRQQILDLCAAPNCQLGELGELGVALGRAYGEAVNLLLKREGLSTAQIRAVGCHGQTLFHQPSGSHPFSMQLVNAPVLAATCGITAITDFRSMDIALGGQGAPLVPLFHRTLTDPVGHQSTVFLNIGGMANISVIHPAPLMGFDTGPGNVLMDSWIQQCRQQPYDRDGAMAAAGQVDLQLLQMLLQEPYFALPAPKSTGRELFNLLWLQQQLAILPGEISDEDVMATLVALTATTIAHALLKLPAGKLLICGGGSRNPELLKQLRLQLPDWSIETTDAVGVDVDYMEAMAFAWLAYRTMTGQTATEPSVTGSQRPELAGQITPLLSHPLQFGE